MCLNRLVMSSVCPDFKCLRAGRDKFCEKDFCCKDDNCATFEYLDFSLALCWVGRLVGCIFFSHWLCGQPDFGSPLPSPCCHKASSKMVS